MRKYTGMGLGCAMLAAAAFAGQAYAQDGCAGGKGKWSQLTPDQRAQVKSIMQQAHTDVQSLVTQAHDQVRALLDPQQQAQFDAAGFLTGPAGHPVLPVGAAGTNSPAPGASANESGTTASGAAQPGVDRHLQHLTQLLNLTTDQQTAVATILNNAHTAMQTQHQQAEAAFKALLTPDQLATLNQLKSQAPAQAGPGGPRGGWREHGPGGPAWMSALQLTPDQQAQAKTIFEQSRTQMEQIHTQTHEQIRALLTPDQQTQFDALPPPPGPGFGGMHARHRGPGANPAAQLSKMTSELNLTEAEIAGIEPILTNLHTEIRTRMQQAHADVQALLGIQQQSAPSANPAGSAQSSTTGA